MARNGFLLLLVVLAGLAAACGGGGEESTTAGGRIVAEVNGVPIAAERVEEVSEADRLLLSDDEHPLEPAQALELRRRALDLIIAGELIHQDALARGMRVPESEIDDQLEVARSQFATQEEFVAHLDAVGSSPEGLRTEIQRRLLLEAYVDELTGGLDLDEEAARRIYEEQEDRFMGEEQVRVAQILIRVRPNDPAPDKERARQRIDEAHRRAMAGEEFGALAREYSNSPFAEKGGDMGFFARGRTLPEFESVVFSLPVGKISPVFETPHGYNVVKILDRRESGRRTYEEVRTELLMVMAREQQDRILQDRVGQLRAQAEIRILDPDLQPVD